MEIVVGIWEEFVKDENMELNFSLDFLDFVETLWGEEVYDDIDLWMTLN